MRYLVFMIMGMFFGFLAFLAIGNVLPLNVAWLGGILVCVAIIIMCLKADAAMAREGR